MSEKAVQQLVELIESVAAVIGRTGLCKTERDINRVLDILQEQCKDFVYSEEYAYLREAHMMGMASRSDVVMIIAADSIELLKAEA